MPSLAYKCTDKGYISFGNINEFGSFHGDILTLIYSNEEYKGDICIDNYINGIITKKEEYYWGNGGYEKISETGWGIRYLKDGKRIFEGMMERGFPRGVGFFTYKGNKYSGIYKLNKKRCLFISNNNKAYITGISHEQRFNEASATQYKTEVHN